MSERHSFNADVSRLLDIVTHALYTEREIFLRELISNAADACDRLRYAAIAEPALLEGEADYKIDIAFDPQARTLRLCDNGIGMTRDELARNLGTIAHSGTRELMSGAAGKDMNLIGQFGVGFYSAFMVAEKVEVTSRRAGAGEAWTWTSDGRSGFEMDSALKKNRGTEILLHLKDDAGEFLLEERLTQVVKKYSDHIDVPIAVGGKTVNQASALWTRPKAEVTEAQYASFYKAVSGALPLDAPWMTLHWKAEGAVEYANLLFIPSMKPFDLYDPRRHHGVKLYVRRVFIAEGVEGLIPPFLRFVKGVVDSQDLPLNISRETLQANPLVAKMSAAIVRKILSELEDKAVKEPESFAEFWALFGPVVKEGLYDAHAHREQLLRVARFRSSAGEGLVSLEDYAARMKEGQGEIYYLSAPSPEAAMQSPQMEAFRARGVEVLFMTDAIDEFWLPMQADYKGKPFKSVTRGGADLSKIKGGEAPEPARDDGDATAGLVARLKDILGDEVKDVAVSTRLVDSPVCLIAPEGGVDIQMQKLLKKQQGYEAEFRPVLEINPAHPLIARMRSLAANDGETLRDAALLLLDQARILEGEPLKNPADFARRLSRAMEKGLA